MLPGPASPTGVCTVVPTGTLTSCMAHLMRVQDNLYFFAADEARVQA